ncbi:MAG: S1 RNA-binding domain-containing protein [Oscillospiraceae bacterium]|nr:S1 RNA-binding domain-containing protein [Oscillospiraceae bacterium]
MKKYLPEGILYCTAENKLAMSSAAELEDAAKSGRILEARVSVCTGDHDLIVELPCMKGIIPREEGAIGIADGSTRDIALITKVNKPVCFKVMSVAADENGQPVAYLSRLAAQLECMESYISRLSPGDIIPARVTHLEQFGAFVDIGCGISSLVPIDAISVSRISHPSDRFYNGEDIKVIVKGFSDGRVWLSHKELLGTWVENAAMFSAGETVSGVIRSVESYGIFVELTPNLAGLAEPKAGVRPGQQAGVYIKALIPEKMKVKLIIVDVFDSVRVPGNINYFIESGKISHWKYSADGAERIIESYFN